jgi:hypothetical protein
MLTLDQSNGLTYRNRGLDRWWAKRFGYLPMSNVPSEGGLRFAGAGVAHTLRLAGSLTSLLYYPSNKYAGDQCILVLSRGRKLKLPGSAYTLRV